MNWETVEHVAMAVIALGFAALLFLPRFAPRRVSERAATVPRASERAVTMPGAGPYRTAGPREKTASVEPLTPELATAGPREKTASVEPLTPELAIEAALARASAELANGKISTSAFNLEVERLTHSAMLVKAIRVVKKGASS